MEYDVLHDIPGRMRVKCRGIQVNKEHAEVIGVLLSAQQGIETAELSLRTGNLLIRYSRITPKDDVLALLDVLEPSDWEDVAFELVESLPSFVGMSFSAAVKTIAVTGLKILLLPPFIRYGLILKEAMPIFSKGLNSFRQKKLDIAALDATALAILAVRRDFRTMRFVMWMIEASESFNEWTKGQSHYSLKESLDLKIDSVWLKTDLGERKCPMSDVKPGDLLVARTGWVIPVDGTVTGGEALVNQSILTGEGEAVRKAVGLSVFAGSVVDEGELIIRVENTAGKTRLQNIITFIEESEAFKGDIQSKAERMANALIPCTFLLSLAVLAVTRNPVQASTVLMVDYTCATRLATPLTILSTIMEGVKHGVLIKSGKHIEAMAQADSLVIDKTGTLTKSKPSVSKIIGFNGWDKADVLRIAACIEEHFHHPVGRAVVKKAEAQGLHYSEQRHAAPEYVPAHGIVSMLEGKHIAIGSGHFLFDDLRVPLTEEVDLATREKAAKGRSLLYMAYDGKIVGMLSMEDPVRSDASDTLADLSKSGVRCITMLTGDGARTAKAVAETLGIQSYRSGLLPVDKAELIKEMQQAGSKVMFVGDGVNDSPALSASDVGISLQDGSDAAKEMAGVVLLDGKLGSLVTARQLSSLALSRINRQFAFVVGLNTALLGLGLLGCISPHSIALLHNSGTVLVTANSIRRLLPPKKPNTSLLILDTKNTDFSGPAASQMEVAFREN